MLQESTLNDLHLFSVPSNPNISWSTADWLVTSISAYKVTQHQNDSQPTVLSALSLNIINKLQIKNGTQWTILGSLVTIQCVDKMTYKNRICIIFCWKKWKKRRLTFPTSAGAIMSLTLRTACRTAETQQQMLIIAS